MELRDLQFAMVLSFRHARIQPRTPKPDAKNPCACPCVDHHLSWVRSQGGGDDAGKRMRVLL